MFTRTARQIDESATRRSAGQALSRWASTQDTWYDGTPDSVDRRIAACDHLLAKCNGAVARLGFGAAGHYLAAAEELKADRESLAALRRDLVTGCADREDAAPPLGRRTAMRSIPPTPSRYVRFIELEAKDFSAQNPGLSRHELRERARRHAENKTSTMSRAQSRIVTAAFVDRVEELAGQARRPSVRTAATATVRDFDDQLLTL